MMAIEIYQDESENAEWRWRVTDLSEQVIGKSSEGYSRRRYAENNLSALPMYCRAVDIKTASEADERSGDDVLPLEFYQDEVDQWRWRVRAGNGLIVHASAKGWDLKIEAVANIEALVRAAKQWSP